MEISYLEGEKFKIKTKTGSLVLSPSSVTMSHKATSGEDFVITKPGEYEVEGVSVFGYQTGEQTVYVIEGEDVRVLWLGKLKVMPEEKILGELENIDVVAFVSGGMEDKTMVELIGKLEPYYVVPLGEGKESFVTAYEHGRKMVKSLSISRLSLTDEVTEVIEFE